jgi:hypothetical protein
MEANGASTAVVITAQLDFYRTKYYYISMSLYKTRPFARIAKKAGITDAALKAAMDEMREGIIHADLGGNVYKQRVALPGRGKRGGSRVIVAANLQDRWIFVHCYLKNDQGDIAPDEELAFKEFARIYLGLSGEALQTAVERGILEKIP